MNETLKTIACRYSCRNFEKVMPAKEDIDLLAKAAVQAPSANNRQPWKIIIVKNKELLAEIEAEGMRQLELMPDKTMYERIKSRGGKMFYDSPCMFIITTSSTEKNHYTTLDCGIVVENIALAAQSLGLGNVICGMTGLIFSGDNAEYFKEKLGFEKEQEFVISILIGHSKNPTAPHEPNLSKITVIE